MRFQLVRILDFLYLKAKIRVFLLFFQKIKVKLGLYKLQINFNEATNLPFTVVCFLEFDGHIEIGNNYRESLLNAVSISADFVIVRF